MKIFSRHFCLMIKELENKNKMDIFTSNNFVISLKFFSSKAIYYYFLKFLQIFLFFFFTLAIASQ